MGEIVRYLPDRKFIRLPLKLSLLREHSQIDPKPIFEPNKKLMETKHPLEESFGSDFPAICNHCGVMAAWSRKKLKFCEKFVRFLEKRLRK